MSTKKKENPALIETQHNGVTMILEKKSNGSKAPTPEMQARMEAGKVEIMKVVEGVPGAEKLGELIERGKKKGNLSSTELMDVLEDMDGRISGVVDGGPCAVGVESTILDLTCDPPRLLRPGGLPLEDLERLIGKIDVDKAVNGALAEGEKPKAPGMKYRHYAPKAPVTVVQGAPAAAARYIQAHMAPGDGVICFDEYAGLFAGHPLEQLGPSTDVPEQARRVFEALRWFDGTGVSHIWAQCPAAAGIGLAVANRLNKAAGFHIVRAE